MKVIQSILLASLAIVMTEAGMMGPPMGIGGMASPPMGAGIPPFVAQLIASKGKPFGPGMGFAPQAPASAGPETGTAFVPPPTAAYVQSLLAAKAAAGLPFVPTTIPMGPPPFVAQLIAAKNAAAEQAAQLAAAQQLAATQGTGQANPDALPNPAMNATPAVPPSFGQTGSPSAPASPISAQDWLQQLIQSSIAKKLASKTPAGASPAGAAPPMASFQPIQNSFGDAQPALQQRRDTVPADGTAPQQPQAGMPPMGYPPFPPMGYPPVPMGPMPYPMMPFYPPIPFWKLG